MTEDQQSPLFREEALQHYAESSVRGRLLQISPSWNRWVFWLLLAALVGGVVFVFVVQIDRWVSGPVVALTRSTAVAAFPRSLVQDASRASGVVPGQSIWVQFSGGQDRVAFEITETDPAGALPQGLLQRLKVVTVEEAHAAFLVVMAENPSMHDSSAAGEAEVNVGRRSLYEALRPGRSENSP